MHTQRWVREMNCRGHRTTLVTRNPWSETGVDVITVTARGGYLKWGSHIAEVHSIAAQIKPDLVHGHYVASYAFWAAACGHRPLVLTACGSPKTSWLKRQLTAWTLRRADLITADPLDVLDEIRTYGTRARLEQVQRGVDLNRIRSGVAAERQVLNVVSLRSWTPNYNIDLILRAFAEFTRALPSRAAHLHLLGGGVQETSLRVLADTLGIASHVTFHGMVDEAHLLGILEQADISVSVPTNDATAMSLLESMAAGLPVVVSDLKANRQWVNETGGRIVPVGDTTAVASALIELAQNVELRARMGKRNRAEIEARASREKEMDRMASLYESLLSVRR